MTALGELTKPKVDQLGPPAAGEFVYVDISSVDNKSKRIVEPKRLGVEAAPSRARQRLKAGDVLVSMTRPNLNAVAMVPPDLDGAVGSTGFHVLRANEKVLPNWLYYGVQSRNFIEAMSGVVQGALYPAVRPRDIQSFDLPAPDVDEQRRIVAEIEKQFSRLDEAVANLLRVKANLKRYKAAVLKTAVEGRLVAAEAELARLGDREYQTGEKLLADVLVARRTGGKRKAAYEEPRPPDEAGSLPTGWAWASVEQLNPANRPCAYGVLQPGDDLPNGVPFVRVGDIDDGRIEFTGMKAISPAIAAAYPRTKLVGGEILLTLVGAIGRTAVVPPTLAGANVARAVGVLPILAPIDPHWVEIWFRNPAKIAEMTGKSHEVARKTLNLADVRSATVAIPPLAEQRRIVAEVDRRLSIVREVEAEVDANLKRAQALRSSMLSAAFAHDGRMSQ